MIDGNVSARRVVVFVVFVGVMVPVGFMIGSGIVLFFPIPSVVLLVVVVL